MSKKSPISKRLKEARIEAGISQKMLGIAAGVDEFVASARMNQYETGKHVPNYVMVQKIASVLRLPVAFFYTTDNALASFLKAYAKLNTDQRQRLVKIVDKMVVSK